MNLQATTIFTRGSAVALLLLAFAAPGPALAVPLDCNPALTPPPGPAAVFCGTDLGNTTTQSNAAFAAWSAAVGPFTLENIDGAVSPAFGGPISTPLGNTFTGLGGASLIAPNFTFQVLQGIHLQLVSTAQPPLSFRWDLPASAGSFGFFGRSNAGQRITVAFAGGESPLEFDAVGTGNDNLFFGIQSLAAPISSVTITTGDSDSRWDRFGYVVAPQDVPAPGTALLVLAGFAALRRLRRG